LGHRALAVLALPLLLAACPGCRTGGPVAPRPLGGLLVRCEPADALVYVDDHLEGNASRLAQQPLALPEGFHRVEIRKDGFFPHFAEVTVVKGVRQTIEVTLRKEPF
jgi:hypothetical protein